MKDSIKMFMVLTGVTTICGLLLSSANNVTKDKIIMQHIKYMKGPAINKVLTDVDNDPFIDHKVVNCSGEEIMLFLGKKDGKLTGVALETAADGYGGPVQVITGFDPESGNCKAVAIAVASETPGIGTKVKDQTFTCRFNGLPLSTPAALSSAGGSIDGVSGATISSKAVCIAVARAQKMFVSVQSSLKGVAQ